jgi:hypothetical protein
MSEADREMIDRFIAKRGVKVIAPGVSGIEAGRSGAGWAGRRETKQHQKNKEKAKALRKKLARKPKAKYAGAE